MISHAQFGKLRLKQFLPDHELASLEDWEFMDRSFIGEAWGFSEWLRWEKEPKFLRSLAIDFANFPAEAARQVLRAIELPVDVGMTLPQLHKVLGKPVEQNRYTDDRMNYDFVIEKPHSYNVSATILNDGGLTYLVVAVPFA